MHYETPNPFLTCIQKQLIMCRLGTDCWQIIYIKYCPCQFKLQESSDVSAVDVRDSAGWVHFLQVNTMWAIACRAYLEIRIWFGPRWSILSVSILELSEPELSPTVLFFFVFGLSCVWWCVSGRMSLTAWLPVACCRSTILLYLIGDMIRNWLQVIRLIYIAQCMHCLLYTSPSPRDS